MTEAEILEALERKILWLSCQIVHAANHERSSKGSVKVGGHQASSASVVSILTALYFAVLKPEDRVAIKPHASPVFHAIQYLMGNQTLEKLQNFRGYGGAQSYPSRTKDIDDVDFSTGSVGLGVAITAFASMMQDYLHAKDMLGKDQLGRMIALTGDAEFDEGNIFEALQEGKKHGLRNCWWIIDYNRQSLDGVVAEGLSSTISDVLKAFDWEIIELKYGALQRTAFEEPGGHALKSWIDNCPNAVYSAMAFKGGAAWRARLENDLGDQGPFSALLDKRTDDELQNLMTNLGGHCLPTLCKAFQSAGTEKPIAFIAYTIKGWGTPLAGHKDNHAGLMTKDQMATFRAEMDISEGDEWEPFAGLENWQEVRDFLKEVPFFNKGFRRYQDDQIPTSGPLRIGDKTISTQAGFGRLMNLYASEKSELAARIMTTSPDVTVSTNLGAWVNKRRLFSREEIIDTFKDEEIPSPLKWSAGPEGQHIELGIAEMNFFLLLAAAGLSHSLFGKRILPVGTLYDPFISRGLDALNYACYQDARFMLVATPSGITLAPEGGAHQSIATPLIGMSQDGLSSFEPAFMDELSVIMDWGFDYMQKSGEGDPDERTWLRDETGGSVYLRLSTRPLEQPEPRIEDEAFRQAVIDGAYWWKKPGPNADLIIIYQGCVAPEAIEAAGRLGEDRRDIGVLAVTSADRLNAGWNAACRVRNRNGKANCHIETLLADVPAHARLVTVLDGHPATLSWIGGVRGHQTISLGVEHFGQTGTIADLYQHYGIDSNAIVAAAANRTNGRPVRHL